jgi:hypothetical protein
MSDDSKKKDLSGIITLPKGNDEALDPFAVNELSAIEQVDTFESIDEIGMMDHPTDETSSGADLDPSFGALTEPAIESTTQQAIPQTISQTIEQTPVTADPPADDSVKELTAEIIPQSPITSYDEPTLQTFQDFGTPPVNSIDEIRNYSEQSRSSIPNREIHYPFHLMISGQFGPFERDKLILFITENSIGIASRDLDLQLNAGRVLFPRISEFAAVRLIQELRDSGLVFLLKPSARDHDEPFEHSAALQFQFNAQDQAQLSVPQIPILPDHSTLLAQYVEIDSIQTHQFVKAEMIEVERSDLFQEVIERMTQSLKQKARVKGGDALYRLQQKISPLRLPSQYQISVTAVVLKKNS